MKIKITLATLATLLSVGSLSAQQPQQPTQGQPQSNVQHASHNLTGDHLLTKDQVFAKCLAITNQEEVAIAKYAKEKSTNDQVKALATVIEKAHQECLETLKGMETKSAAGKKASNPNVSTTPNPKTTGTSNPTALVANNSGAPVDFLQMHQEISDQCLKDSKEMLSKKEGAEFDSCFVGMQIAKHGMMHSSLTVLQRHTTGELQEFVKASLVKNDEHMKAANNLMEQLSDKAITKTAKTD